MRAADCRAFCWAFGARECCEEPAVCLDVTLGAVLPLALVSPGPRQMTLPMKRRYQHFGSQNGMGRCLWRRC